MQNRVLTRVRSNTPRVTKVTRAAALIAVTIPLNISNSGHLVEAEECSSLPAASSLFRARRSNRIRRQLRNLFRGKAFRVPDVQCPSIHLMSNLRGTQRHLASLFSKHAENLSIRQSLAPPPHLRALHDAIEAFESADDLDGKVLFQLSVAVTAATQAWIANDTETSLSESEEKYKNIIQLMESFQNKVVGEEAARTFREAYQIYPLTSQRTRAARLLADLKSYTCSLRELAAISEQSLRRLRRLELTGSRDEDHLTKFKEERDTLSSWLKATNERKESLEEDLKFCPGGAREQSRGMDNPNRHALPEIHNKGEQLKRELDIDF